MVTVVNEFNVDMLRLKLGLDNLDANVIMANEEHVVVYANNSAINFLSYAESEICKDFPNFHVDGVLGKKIEDFHKNPVYQKKIIGSLRGVLRTHFHVGNLILSVKATPILNDANQRIGFMAEIEDITEKETKKIALLKANEKNLILNNQVNQLQRIESISRLTAGIAHDFNNILSAIIGYNQLNIYAGEDCMDEKLKEEIAFNANQVNIASERAVNLIKKMMAYSRQHPTNREIEVKPTKDVIDEVLRMIRPALTSRFQLHTDIHSELTISIDSTDLHQILTNLLVNARDAMKQGGVIAVSLKKITVHDVVCNACVQILKGDFIELCVADNGTGIELDVIEHIFDPFFTTKPIHEGTGLGLSTVSGMVHEASGHIIVESKTISPNSGTTFRLLFPQP